MRALRFMVAVVAVAAVALALGNDVDAAQKKKKKGGKGVAGTITNVEKSGDNVTLTVKSVNKKTNEAKDVKVTVTKDSKVEKMIGKKKDKQVQAASISDLTTGQSVVVST